MSGWRVEHDGMRPETWWSLRRPDGSVFVWAHFQKGEELREIAAAMNEREALRAALREFIAYAKNLEPDEAVVAIHRRAAKMLGGLEGVPTIDHSARGRGVET